LRGGPDHVDRRERLAEAIVPAGIDVELRGLSLIGENDLFDQGAPDLPGGAGAQDPLLLARRRRWHPTRPDGSEGALALSAHERRKARRRTAAR